MAEYESSGGTEAGTTASLEILTGPARGTASWLIGSALDISLNNADMIRIAPAGGEPLQDGFVARLYHGPMFSEATQQ